ncbi:MAG: GNAT family N-acetyltransferase [Propionibacteriaceae bacterium]|nr:GNAT family N-acetyltransferase [Propionibacteriaceae bacterium]
MEQASQVNLPAGYEFSTDPARLDPEKVHYLLHSYAYWAANRTRQTQDAAIAKSRNYGVYALPSQQQVAYARIVTDEITFAWLADVIVDPEHRGRGLARGLIAGVVADLEPLCLKRIVLKASDEGRHLYEQFGWEPVDNPDSWMELRTHAA